MHVAESDHWLEAPEIDRATPGDITRNYANICASGAMRTSPPDNRELVKLSKLLVGHETFLYARTGGTSNHWP